METNRKTTVMFAGFIGMDNVIKAAGDSAAQEAVARCFERIGGAATSCGGRLAKTMRFGRSSVTLAGEIFNAFNSNTELYRNPNASGTTFNRLDEILAPRIARLSAKFSF